MTTITARMSPVLSLAGAGVPPDPDAAGVAAADGPADAASPEADAAGDPDAAASAEGLGLASAPGAVSRL